MQLVADSKEDWRRKSEEAEGLELVQVGETRERFVKEEIVSPTSCIDFFIRYTSVVFVSSLLIMTTMWQQKSQSKYHVFAL